MPPDFLTRDNARFAHPAVVESPPAPPFAYPSDAASCTSLSIPSVEVYVQSGIAQATRRAYRADFDHFAAWGGTIPATDDLVAAYIADHASVLKVSTLTRRLAAISIAHGPADSQTRQPVNRSGRRCAASAVLTERLNIRPSPSSVRTSLPFSGRWAIGSRTSEIGLCC